VLGLEHKTDEKHVKDGTTEQDNESLVLEVEGARATIVAQVSVPLQLVEETCLRRSSRKGQMGKPREPTIQEVAVRGRGAGGSRRQKRSPIPTHGKEDNSPEKNGNSNSPKKQVIPNVHQSNYCTNKLWIWVS